MSYSFNIRAACAGSALVAVCSELDKVVEQQPIHAADRQAAIDAANAQINLLREPREGEEISLSVSGSVARWTAEDTGFTNASVSVHAGILTKETEQ